MMDRALKAPGEVHLHGSGAEGQSAKVQLQSCRTIFTRSHEILVWPPHGRHFLPVKAIGPVGTKDGSLSVMMRRWGHGIKAPPQM